MDEEEQKIILKSYGWLASAFMLSAKAGELFSWELDLRHTKRLKTMGKLKDIMLLCVSMSQFSNQCLSIDRLNLITIGFGESTAPHRIISHHINHVLLSDLDQVHFATMILDLGWELSRL